ncbi:MAG: metallophosphoesterase [Burkholderiales bacterium]|nr:metallophosphoesterase [Burkholderiales bacterium]MDE2626199.1 metallophosphoesterase [Burkholderiales bacterium]
MRTLVHLSDLHFGRVDPALLAPLVETVGALAPDVVVVSGDLTQRARRAQFIQAQAFLARLPGPQIVVPGNHDVPLYNVVDRLLRPLHKFRRYIEPSLNPSYLDDEIAVLGINTARALVLKNGRINAAQLESLRAAWSEIGEEVVKVVVTHHPFDVPAHIGAAQRVGRAGMAMSLFAQHGADVLLAGHLHASRSGGTGERYALGGYEALVVSAGTATSTRGRGEANSFNVLRLQKERVEVERFEWLPDARRFAPTAGEVFERRLRGWASADAGPATPQA